MIDLNRLDEIKWLLDSGFELYDGTVFFEFDTLNNCYTFQFSQDDLIEKNISCDNWNNFEDQVYKFLLGVDSSDNNVQK